MINVNDLNPKNIKLDKKSNTDTLIYYIGYQTTDFARSLDISFKKMNEYIEDNNENDKIKDNRKYLTLIPVDRNKSKVVKYKEE